LLHHSSRSRHRRVTDDTSTKRASNDRVTPVVGTMDWDQPRGGAMETLVIQISMWRDEGTIRARLRSDADGSNVVVAATTIGDMLAHVDAEIVRWAGLLADDDRS